MDDSLFNQNYMRDNNEKITLTIGIPAYNEKENITGVLNSILKQKQESYVLEKIIVFCDGSNDGTQNVVKSLIKKNPKIELVDDGRRLWKLRRLMQLYEINTSEIVMVFDADVILGSNVVIEKMMGCFNDPQMVMVNVNSVPVEPRTFTEKMIWTWTKLWFEARKDINGGDSINNARGCGTALRKSFSKKIDYLTTITSEAQFLYCMVKKFHLKYRFLKDECVYFRLPDNIKDYLTQKNRTNHETEILASYFGRKILPLYKVPRVNKIRALAYMTLVSPVNLVMSILFQFYISFLEAPDNSRNPLGTFQRINSTKKKIELSYN